MFRRMRVTQDQALQILNENGVVAVPTETVYGLAARVDSESGVQQIFVTKERPYFDPLIVHVASVSDAQRCVSHWPELAQQLADRFWPGPLTLVLPKSKLISDVITSGLTTVGIRIPQHDLCLSLLRSLPAPLAAPSANKFGRTSPTAAEHVEQEFSHQVPVLDGGPCEVGIESTIVEVLGDRLVLLRPGLITQSEIESKLGFSPFIEKRDKVAPGNFRHHYMPSKPLVFCERQIPSEELRQKIWHHARGLPTRWEGVALAPVVKVDSLGHLSLPPEAVVAARVLYSELRDLACRDIDVLVFTREPHQHGELWETVLGRLRKAAVLHM